MVECCWTAASSSLSRMVHSPMVTKRCRHRQDRGLQVRGASSPPPSKLWTAVLLVCSGWSCRPAGVRLKVPPLLLLVALVSDLGTSDSDLWPPASWVWQSEALLPGRSHSVSSPPLLEERC